TNLEHGQYAFIIDGEGVLIAHHNTYLLETLTNYKTMMRTVPMTDDNGNAMTNADGSVITVEEEFIVSGSFNEVIVDVMSGRSGLELVDIDGNDFYMSYEPIDMPGYSDSWSVVTLHDRDVAMGVVTRLVTQQVIVVLLILAVFLALIFTFFKSLSRTLNYLENARTEADQANKSKSDFLATMSHEIRTPLNAIIGLTQLQLQKKELPQESLEAIETIYASGSNLLKIINDILDLSKVETGKLDITPEIYEIASMINDTVQLNIVRIGDKDIEFILEVEDDLPSRILGDGLRVKQILNNLLSNAIKYTNDGFVRLKVSHTEKGDDITLSFEVEDSGKGIAYENQQWLFSEYTRFNTSDDVFTEGTGLGLTITKKLAEMMDGGINVKSMHGKGSIFTVTVKQKAVLCSPIGADIAKRLRHFTFTGDSIALSQLEYADLKNYNVLVVDDIEINLYVAEAVLEPYNLNIDLVIGGAETIEKIKNGKVYDIIFMDHMMPEMDGIETTKKLRELGYKGAIVALTANALVGNEEMFTTNGFDGFIAKPIDIHDLDDIIENFIIKKGGG
ncbi:MAG: response regulator, partial [Oscillospiraceae bacterium]|nr:response regulator [Oscillospiraceae bacterium]